MDRVWRKLIFISSLSGIPEGVATPRNCGDGLVPQAFISTYRQDKTVSWNTHNPDLNACKANEWDALLLPLGLDQTSGFPKELKNPGLRITKTAKNTSDPGQKSWDYDEYVIADHPSVSGAKTYTITIPKTATNLERIKALGWLRARPACDVATNKKETRLAEDQSQLSQLVEIKEKIEKDCTQYHADVQNIGEIQQKIGKLSNDKKKVMREINREEFKSNWGDNKNSPQTQLKYDEQKLQEEIDKLAKNQFDLNDKYSNLSPIDASGKFNDSDLASSIKDITNQVVPQQVNCNDPDSLKNFITAIDRAQEKLKKTQSATIKAFEKSTVKISQFNPNTSQWTDKNVDCDIATYLENNVKTTEDLVAFDQLVTLCSNDEKAAHQMSESCKDTTQGGKLQTAEQARTAAFQSCPDCLKDAPSNQWITYAESTSKSNVAKIASQKSANGADQPQSIAPTTTTDDTPVDRLPPRFFVSPSSDDVYASAERSYVYTHPQTGRTLYVPFDPDSDEGDEMIRQGGYMAHNPDQPVGKQYEWIDINSDPLVESLQVAGAITQAVVPGVVALYNQNQAQNAYLNWMQMRDNSIRQNNEIYQQTQNVTGIQGAPPYDFRTNNGYFQNISANLYQPYLL